MKRWLRSGGRRDAARPQRARRQGAAATLPAAAAVLAALGALAAAASPPAAADDPAAAAPGVPDLMGRIEILAGPQLAGRAAGSEGGRAAADTLAGWLAAWGLRPAFPRGWAQEFPLRSSAEDAGEPIAVGRNVGAVLAGGGALAGRWLVLGAHYDHLGPCPSGAAAGDSSAQDPAADQGPAGCYHPGANDNASGVSAVFAILRSELARAQSGADRRSLLCVFFDAEEIGLQGSAHLVRNLPVPADSIDAMINLDTVGQLNDGVLYVSGVGTAEVFPEVLRSADPAGLQLSLAQGGWSGSDHMVFNTAEIPVLFLFGGAYPQYNRPDDRPAAIDAGALSAVAAFAGDVVARLRSVPGPWPWIMVAARSEIPAGAAEGNRNTWLGTLPDFREGVAGYPLAGVFPDSPAARAGLRKGDVLVSLGGRPVADLAGFTAALRANAPGELVELVVLRDGRALNFTVVLGDRADRK